MNVIRALPRPLAVAVAAFLFVACSSAAPVATLDLNGTLSVLEWSGYEDPLYWADFQTAYPNAKLNWEFGTSDADIYGKMKAGSQADVFHPYTGWLQFYVDEGLVSEIDTTKLKNWDKVPDNFKEVGKINGKQYFVPFDWGFTSIMRNPAASARASARSTRSHGRSLSPKCP